MRVILTRVNMDREYRSHAGQGDSVPLLDRCWVVSPNHGRGREKREGILGSKKKTVGIIPSLFNIR